MRQKVSREGSSQLIQSSLKNLFLNLYFFLFFGEYLAHCITNNPRGTEKIIAKNIERHGAGQTRYVDNCGGSNTNSSGNRVFAEKGQ